MGGYLESGGLTTWYDEEGCRRAARAASRRALYERDLGGADVRLVGVVPSDRAGAAGAWSHTRYRGTSVVWRDGGGHDRVLDGAWRRAGASAGLERRRDCRAPRRDGPSRLDTQARRHRHELRPHRRGTRGDGGIRIASGRQRRLGDATGAVRGGFPGRPRALASGGRQVQGDGDHAAHDQRRAAGGITAHTLVVVGDDDIVALDHTASLFRAIPNSELAVVPGTSHFAAMEKPELVNRLVLDFLQRDPVPTYMPLRRAAAGADHEG